MKKLEAKEQKYLKGVSKALYILSKIGKILVTVGIVCFLIGMIALYIVIGKIDYHDNTIYFDNKQLALIKTENESVSLQIKDESNNVIKIIDNELKDDVEILQLKHFFDDNSMLSIKVSIISVTVFGLAILFILRIIMFNTEKLFKNINTLRTPFSEENVMCIREIFTLLIVNSIIAIVANIVISLIIKTKANIISFNVGNVFEILVICVIFYIFKYGMFLQEKSKNTIYDDIK